MIYQWSSCEFDAVIVRSATKLTKDVIEASNGVKVIGRAGVGGTILILSMQGICGIPVVNALKLAQFVVELTIVIFFPAFVIFQGQMLALESINGKNQ